MVIKRNYNIPLRREFQKAPYYKKSKKAVTAVVDFLKKHMKSDNIKIGKNLNDKIWENGIRNPPHHIEVTVLKDDEGVVRAELVGFEAELEPKTEGTESSKAQKSKTSSEEEKAKDSKESKPAAKAVKAEETLEKAVEKTEEKVEAKPKAEAKTSNEAAKAKKE